MRCLGTASYPCQICGRGGSIETEEELASRIRRVYSVEELRLLSTEEFSRAFEAFTSYLSDVLGEYADETSDATTGVTLEDLLGPLPDPGHLTDRIDRSMAAIDAALRP